MEALNSIYRDLLPHVAEFLKLTLNFSDPYLKFLYTAFRQHLKVAPISKLVNGYLDYSGRSRDLSIQFQSGVVTLDLSNNELTNSTVAINCSRDKV